MHHASHQRIAAKRRMLSLLVAATGTLLCTTSFGQDFPNRPIRMIAPYVAGASTDTLARTVAQGMSQILGQPVVVENKPGAGGILAADFVAKAPADGYTIMLTSEGIMTMNPVMYKKIPYDPQKDFDSLSVGVRMPLLIVANPAQPFKTVAELLRAAKATPGRFTYGSAGVGSSQHMAGELFKSMANIDILHIPYKGGGPAMNDLLGNQISMMFVQLPSALGQVKAGRVVPVAIGSEQRNPTLPVVPTVSEAGVPGYNSDTWYGFAMPRGVPADISKKLHDAVVKTLEDNKEKMAREGFYVVAGTQKQMDQTVAEGLKKWAKVVKDAGLSAE